MKRFFITDVQLEALFNYLEQSNLTKREAVCQFAVDNYQDLFVNVPNSYPRTTEEMSQTALDVVAVLVASLDSRQEVFVDLDADLSQTGGHL